MSETASLAAAYRTIPDTFGLWPSEELAAVIRQLRPRGRALDLGCGPGRDSLMLAENGLLVDAVDASPEALYALTHLSAQRGLSSLIRMHPADLRDFRIEHGQYSVIASATALDHLERADVDHILNAIAKGLTPEGIVFLEVHTARDPGATGIGPRSEFATLVKHYFAPGELLSLGMARFDVLRYEEKLEWDNTHGMLHYHGFATYLGCSKGATVAYYGMS